MNVEQYLEKRRKLSENQPTYRTLCLTCRQPDYACYCAQISKFDPIIKFAILIHPIEAKRRIASGRMSHQCLENSELILGQDYSKNVKVNALLKDPKYYPVILYPGFHSLNISNIENHERRALFPPDKEILIFVIDGTWNTARKTVWRSVNLRDLPRICFSAEKPSTWRVRKQPAPGCYSTLEAIHHTIELLGPSFDFDTASREHDKLLYVFDYMVEKQIEISRRAAQINGGPSYRHRHPRQAVARVHSPF